MDIEVYVELCRRGVISANQLVSALGEQVATCKPLGQFALHERMLTTVELFEVLARQATDPRPFGEIAVECGFLTEEQVAILIYRQTNQLDPLGRILVRQGAISSAEEFNRLRFEVRRQLLAMATLGRRPETAGA
jgi:hypothetical protein